MEPLVFQQWYRIRAKDRNLVSYIRIYHGRSSDGKWILEIPATNTGGFSTISLWHTDNINRYDWEPVDVGTLI